MSHIRRTYLNTKPTFIIIASNSLPWFADYNNIVARIMSIIIAGRQPPSLVQYYDIFDLYVTLRLWDGQS
jgi:hypothetical protein